ncbi:hypothetical protein GCM10009765_10740 [Fodinicola feengrottensis]|uniref:Uncharacterized protein n=1 Tax=Fodinicola feengrottensis TaxID=435914 RepID=A0ABN2G0G1_9ACTN
MLFVFLLSLARGTAFHPGYPTNLALVAVSALLAGFGLGPLAAMLRLPPIRRIAVLFGIVFVLLSASNAVEVALYLPAATVLGTLAGGLLQSLALSVLLGLFFRPADTDDRLGSALAIRSPLSWGWRVVVLGVLWVPVFLLCALADTPVVEAIEKSARTQTFTSPPMAVLVSSEFVRGLLHAAVFVVIVALLRRRWPVAWLWCAVSLALLNGWIPIITQTTLAPLIRVANGVEITLSSVIFGLLAAWLLAHRAAPAPDRHAG